MVKNKPYSPKGHFLLGNTNQFRRSTIGFIENLRQQSPEGIAHAKIAFRDFYILLHPDYIAHVLQKNNKNYVKSFAYEGLKDFLGNGLLTNEGSFWLKQRRLIQPAFYKENLKSYEEIMRTETVEWLKNIQPNSRLDLQKEFLKLTGKILNTCLFGSQVETNTEQLFDLLLIFRRHANNKMKNPFHPPLWVPSKRNKQFNSALHDLKKLLIPLIETARNEAPSNTLLSTLTHLEDADTKEKMSNTQIMDEVITLFLAGQETTTSSLTFAIWLLASHKPELNQLQSEIEHTSDRSYLKNCVKEILRLYPPGWAVSRKAIKNDSIGGYNIPVNAVVFLSIYAMHRHPDFWKEPDRFNPDRFKDIKNHPSYLPFGAGPRICIGNNFALMEIEIILEEIIKSFNPIVISPTELTVITPMTMSIKEPLIARFESRQ